jgi:hypothetical protein
LPNYRHLYCTRIFLCARRIWIFDRFSTNYDQWSGNLCQGWWIDFFNRNPHQSMQWLSFPLINSLIDWAKNCAARRLLNQERRESVSRSTVVKVGADRKRVCCCYDDNLHKLWLGRWLHMFVLECKAPKATTTI